MQPKRNRNIAIILAAIAIGITPASANEPDFLEGVTYGVVDGVELQLNIAIPSVSEDSDERFPLIVFIHGGGWQTGHRNAYNGRIRQTAERGYVAATLSHRLTSVKDDDGRPLHPWPAAIHDCKAAIRFLKTYAERYRIDPNRIGATGASSGGHLSLLLGLTDTTDGLEGTIPVPMQTGDGAALEAILDTRIHAVYNKSGPTDMLSCHAAPVVTPFMEDLLGPPQSNLEKYRAASPLTYLSPNDPPVMSIHGDLDHVVPVEQARILHAQMNAMKLANDYIELEGQKHIFNKGIGTTYWDSCYAFFDKHLKER